MKRLIYSRSPKSHSRRLLDRVREGIVLAALILAASGTVVAAEVAKKSAAELNSTSLKALAVLTSTVPAAKALMAEAHAVLVFPEVTKAGLIVGGQYGEGTLIKKGKPVAHYSTAGVSAGLQGGYQTYGYALFLMTPTALAALDKADGFEIGVGPSVVVVDEGMGKNLTTTTMKQDIYAFIFSQKGLMLALGIQGTRIARIEAK